MMHLATNKAGLTKLTFTTLAIFVFMMITPVRYADAKLDGSYQSAAKGISFNKTVFKSQDTIIIHLPKKRLLQLGLKTPAGKYYFIAASPKNDLKSLYSSAEYAKLHTIIIPINNFRLIPYEYGSKGKEPVFKTPGTYEFQFGNNLETDEGPVIKKIIIR